ncbi:hypothetical protein [Spiroplasma endosymbiont of Melieria omissa]|uniref:hypothetical protein n=1 Tax=Spiroplasma endosymbiont of Melieria omissa TaxID=3139324 RepID=UPI003CCB6D99
MITGLLAWIIVWSCQLNYNRDYYLSLLRYHWSSEMSSFIKENERKIKNPASQMANNEFNSFYDNASKPLPFLDFNQLAHDLTNTRLGTQNSNVDWEKLYQRCSFKSTCYWNSKKRTITFL